MVLQSGTPPYDYAVGDPLRVVHPYGSSYVVGGSGNFIEQAQFVITTEIRKFSSESDRLEDFHVYVNPVIAPSGPYEPKANGSTLGNLLNPANMFIINHILETRSALDILFAFYALESEHITNALRVDWLTQINAQGVFPSGYRRRDPGVTAYPFLVTSDVTLLGGSGVLFDLDFAEVMFNPYPVYAYNRFMDVHGLGAVSIFGGPAWPGFQKTDGSLIGLNGREPTPLDGITSEYETAHISSGAIRLDGHAFLPATDYVIGHGVQNFVIDGTFAFFGANPRNALNNRPFTASRTFVTPPSIPSGVYKLAARNRREVVPFTAVASGLVSQWPPSGQAYPATNGHIFSLLLSVNDKSLRYSDAQYELGYQVFNDAFWVIDSLNTREPSGLAVLSPFTGHPLWVRFADLTKSTGSGLFGGSVGSAGSWGKHIGLERVGSIIHRLQRDSSDGSTSAIHRALIQTYNDNLDYLSQIETPDTDVGASATYTDLAFAPILSQWLLHRGGVLERYDSTFTTFIESQGISYIGALNPDGAANLRCVAEVDGIVRGGAEFEDGNGAPGDFHTQGSGIWDFDFTFPIASGAVVKNCRIIDLSKVIKSSSSLNRAIIYDIQTVPGTAVHTVPGTYALASFGTSANGESHRLFLLRIQARDDATAPGFCVGFWDVLAAYDLGPVPTGPTTTVNNFPNLLWKEID